MLNISIITLELLNNNPVIITAIAQAVIVSPVIKECHILFNNVPSPFFLIDHVVNNISVSILYPIINKKAIIPAEDILISKKFTTAKVIIISIAAAPTMAK